ncbi:MAG: Inner rane CreD family protein [Flavipsychrobacter sp.]|jgi:inner membrane protein|nr:Inner rane CreD family protein [Flavipsychrobacter sp.]
MLTNQNFAPFWERNRVLIKGFMVGFLILIMLIPSALVSELVRERKARHEEIVKEVSSKWAGNQTVTGPVLIVPYKDYEKTSDGKINEHIRTAYLLPEELRINGHMQPLEKKRSLYSVLLYRSDITLSGKFKIASLQNLQIPQESIMWQDARIALNVTDVRGIEDQVQMEWNGAKQLLDAGVPNNQLLKEGLSASVAVLPQTTPSFTINISLKGSENLYFIPVGKITEMDMAADWGSPAFDGAYLPATSDITQKTFNAHWKILPLSRTYPQYWKDNGQDLDKAAFGVKLIQPVDGYSKTDRSVKYALLFIALTFTFFFFLEILQKRMVHPLQYILVGMALTIFYTLLLSISEYTGFNIAYVIASVATVSLISLYVWSMFKNGKTAFSFAFSLSALYGFIYILIRSEDYALLFGSIGLFVIIAIMMYYSRKIDWYGARQIPANIES